METKVRNAFITYMQVQAENARNGLRKKCCIPCVTFGRNVFTLYHY